MQSLQATLLHVSTDWIILVVLLAALTLDAIRSGITRSAAIVTASPIVLALAPLLPHTALLGTFAATLTTPVLQSVLFAALSVLLVLVLHRIIKRYDSYGAGILYSFLSALAATASIVTVWIASDVLQSVWRFGTPIVSVFGATYAFLWLLGSLVVISIVRS